MQAFGLIVEPCGLIILGAVLLVAGLNSLPPMPY
jgi:hypothetical protein